MDFRRRRESQNEFVRSEDVTNWFLLRMNMPVVRQKSFTKKGSVMPSLHRFD